MKKLTFILSLAVLLGTTTVSFAGNHPALSYPSGTLMTSGSGAQLDESTPWHKGALHYAMGVVGPGAWYDRCPAMLNTRLTKANKIVATLSNGQKVMVGCTQCIKIVEDHLAEYREFLF